MGACFEALLAQETIRRRLARTAGWDDLDDVTAARLCVFAALHDIGKVNVGFQARGWKPDDLRGMRGVGRAGHTADLTPVLQWKDRETAEWFLPALGLETIETWDDDDGFTACGLFVAALSHHGRPLQLDDPDKDSNPRIWRSFGELDPREYTEHIGRLVREWFPGAFVADGPPLPSAPEFQHHFLGLCNLADWIGSNEDYFPYVDEPRDDYINTARDNAELAIKTVGLNVKAQRKAFAGVPGFNVLFDRIAEPPNAVQQTARDAPLDAPLVIIESETGSGKTEAALWRFAEMYVAGLVDGLYFALPTRAAAVQIHGRVNDFIARLFPGGAAPETVLAVPGYLQAGDVTGRHLQDYQVWWDDHAADGQRWAAENPKRLPHRANRRGHRGPGDAGLAEGEERAHAGRRAGAQPAGGGRGSRLRRLHERDFGRRAGRAPRRRRVRAADVGDAGFGGAAAVVGRYGCTMSLHTAIAVPYPAVSTHDSVEDTGENGQAKTVRMEGRPAMREPSAIAHIAVAAARAGAKVLVVRNTVDYAVNTWREVAALAGE